MEEALDAHRQGEEDELRKAHVPRQRDLWERRVREERTDCPDREGSVQRLRIVQQETVSAHVRSQPETGFLDLVTNVPFSWPSASAQIRTVSCVCWRPIRHSLSASWSASAGLVPAAEYEWCPSLLRLPSEKMLPDPARLKFGLLSLTPPGCARDFSPPLLPSFESRLPRRGSRQGASSRCRHQDHGK